MLGLTACGKSEDEEPARNATEVVTDSVTESVTPTEEEKPTEEVKPTEEAVVTEAPVTDPDVTAEPTPTEEAAPTEEPVPTDEPISSDVPGPEVSELPDMQKVFDTYYEYVRSNMDDEYSLFETMRFGLAFIDNDDLPELLIADASYHASGVKIIFYNNGNPVNVGEVGEYGCFSYFKKENHIVSSFMGMGIVTISKLHVDPDFKLVDDINLYSDENADEIVLKVDDVEVDEDIYDEKYEEVFASKAGKTILYVNYFDLLPYYPYACNEDLKDAFDQMYEELKDDNYIAFSGYSNENLDKIYDSWDLIKGEAFLKGNEPMYYAPGDENSTEGLEMYSSAYVDPSSGMGIWLSTYLNGDDFAPLTITSYAMDLVYYNSGIGEGLDYGWSVEAKSESTDWSIFACVDDEDHLIIAMSRDYEGEVDEYGYPVSDWIVLTYERSEEIEYTEESDKVFANISRAEDKDVDGKYAFKAKEYIWIFPDDTELIEQYNLPEDLDGYDYELVSLDKEEYIFYIDEDTYIDIIDFDNFPGYKNLEADEFAAREYFGDFMVFFYPDGSDDYAGKTAVSLIMDYTG